MRRACSCKGRPATCRPRPPEAFAGHVEFGRALGKEVLDLAKTIRCDASKRPSLRVAEEEFTFKPRLDVSNPIVKAALSNAFFPDLVAFYEREYRDGVRPTMTVAVLDGKLGIVGVSGEFFCGHAPEPAPPGADGAPALLRLLQRLSAVFPDDRSGDRGRLRHRPAGRRWPRLGAVSG